MTIFESVFVQLN